MTVLKKPASRQTSAKRIENIWEVFIWKFRLFALLPVIFGLLSTLNFFIIGSFEILHTLIYSFSLNSFDEDSVEKVITSVIGGIDHYLIGVVLLIFSFGIYEIFISPLDIRLRHKEVKILKVATVDQLKHKIMGVIVLVLVISFFKKALSLKIESTQDLALMAGSILVVALSAYLMHLQSHNDHDSHEEAN
ncbi:MAG: YqhA family protein [Leptolyngbyaceae cyanobacterium MO_188.B28]|nr:YqhA family protein [Leptolyngbyaceae cyanobacterium MO_188.B28]